MDNLLKLSNQICFPLYALSKEITNMYRPLLEKLDLTYPQYLVMLVLWEKDGQSVGQIGEKLRLDTGTLTPLLKRLEVKDIILRRRSTTDERIVEIFLTPKGQKIQDQAKCIPEQLINEVKLSDTESIQLKQIINKILNTI